MTITDLTIDRDGGLWVGSARLQFGKDLGGQVVSVRMDMLLDTPVLSVLNAQNRIIRELGPGPMTPQWFARQGRVRNTDLPRPSWTADPDLPRRLVTTVDDALLRELPELEPHLADHDQQRIVLYLDRNNLLYVITGARVRPVTITAASAARFAGLSGVHNTTSVAGWVDPSRPMQVIKKAAARGRVSVGGHDLLLGPPYAGREVTVRVEQDTLYLIVDDQQIRHQPLPMPHRYFAAQKGVHNTGA